MLFWWTWRSVNFRGVGISCWTWHILMLNQTRCCHFPNLLSGWSFVKFCWKLVYPWHRKKETFKISKDVFPHKHQIKHKKQKNTQNRQVKKTHQHLQLRLKEARERRQSMTDSSCNAAINACVKVAEWSRALHLFEVRVNSCGVFFWGGRFFGNPRIWGKTVGFWKLFGWIWLWIHVRCYLMFFSIFEKETRARGFVVKVFQSGVFFSKAM